MKYTVLKLKTIFCLRKWADYGIRYGEKAEIGEIVMQEIEAAYPDERLQEIIRQSKEGQTETLFNAVEKLRLKNLLSMNGKNVSNYSIKCQTRICRTPRFLNFALDDEKMSIRRLATVYLGMIEDKAVIPYVEKALKR